MSQTRQSDRNSFLKFYPVTLKTGGEPKTIAAAGNFFICADVTGDGQPFEMSWDSEPYFDFNMGLDYSLSPGDSFSKLTLKNTRQSSDIVAQIYVGSGKLTDGRLNIVRGRAAPIMHAEVVTTAHGDTLAGGAALDLTAGHPTFPKYVRKATIVTNMDPAVDLEILDSADAILDSVLFRTTKLYEMSTGIKIKNNSGAPVVFRAMQIWYIVTN